jgi:amino acid transporter
MVTCFGSLEGQRHAYSTSRWLCLLLTLCSGYVAWVTAAFGPFWGFQVSSRRRSRSSGRPLWALATCTDDGPLSPALRSHTSDMACGLQEGLWSWLSGVTDNSLYPVMLAANLSLFFPVLGEVGWQRRWGGRGQYKLHAV